MKYNFLIIDDETYSNERVFRLINEDEIVNDELCEDIYIQTKKPSISEHSIINRNKDVKLGSYINKHFPNMKIIQLNEKTVIEKLHKTDKDNIMQSIRLSDLKKIIENIKSEIEFSEHKNKLYKQQLSLLKKQLIIDVSNGLLTNFNQLESRAELAGFDKDVLNLPCYTFDIVISNYEITELSLDNLYNIIQSNLKIHFNNSKFIISETSQNKIHTILILQQSNIKDKLNSFVLKINNKFNVEISIVHIECYENLYKLSKACNITKGISINELLNEKEKAFIQYINENSVDLAIDVSNQVITLFGNKNIDVTRKFAKNILTHLNSEIDLLHINEISDFGDLKEFVKTSTYKYLINDDKRSTKYNIINNAKSYINLHYNEDLTLEYVAEKIHLNKMYFCRLFKSITGETFNDYLTAVRMKKSVELLTDHKLKVYEISYLVGYKNTQHFYKLFKNYTNYTPSEYRNKFIN